MDPYTHARRAVEIAQNLARIGEVVAGSTEDRRAVEVLRAILEELYDRVYVESFEVTTWSERICAVESDRGRTVCAVQPMASPGDVEGRPLPIEASEVFSRCRDLRDRIVVVYGVEDPDDIVHIAQAVWRCDAKALVVLDSYPWLRRIVVVDRVEPVAQRCGGIPIPVVQIPSTARRIVECERLRIVAEAVSYRSFSSNIVAEVYGSRDSFVAVSAHYDHWLRGFIDNLLGVGIAVVVGRLLPMYTRSSIRLMIFGAEEGFPSPLTSFYWLVGSRAYVLRHSLDDILLLLNYDVVYKTNLRVSTNSFAIMHIARGIGLETQFDQPIFDSFSFSLAGVAAATIHNFENALSDGIYHSEGDSLEVVGIDRALDSAARAIEIGIEMVSTIRDLVALIEYERRALNDMILKGLEIPCRSMENLFRFVETLGRVPLDTAKTLLSIARRTLVVPYISRKFVEELGERERVDLVYRARDMFMEIPTGFEIDWRKKVLYADTSIEIALDSAIARL